MPPGDKSDHVRFASNADPVRIIRDYTCAYPDPIRLKAGDSLVPADRLSEWPGWVWGTGPNGIAGWVPEAILERSDNGIVVREDYDATELSVRTGDMVIVSRRLSGWAWCQFTDGRAGWVPEECLAVDAG